MTNPNYTHLALVVDRSGSMAGLKNDMEGGIKTLLADQGKQPGELHVDVTTFDTMIEHPYTDARWDDVKGELIVPRGGTALNDAIGLTIAALGEQFSAQPEDERPGLVIFVIVTDGYENSSQEYTTDAIKALVTKQREQYGWQFVYLAANVDAFATGSAYGFDRGQTISMAGTGAGFAGGYAVASASMTRSRLGDVADFTEAERAEAAAE
jgi:uncharacterized protein YegL